MGSLDIALWYGNLAIEAALLGLLSYRRAWRAFPAFFLYNLWSLVGDASLLIIDRSSFSSMYISAYLVDLIVSSALEFCVLVELAWSIFRPYRPVLPRATPTALAGFILLVGIAIWPFTGISGLFHTPLAYHILVRLQQVSSIERVLFFLILAACCHLLSIGWRDRELQISTGLGFYSLVSLAVEIVQSHLTFSHFYVHLNRIVVSSYACSLLYWVFCFARKEPERRPFTPQMQNFLLTLSGSARTARLALNGSGQTQTKVRDRNAP
jgi:hypothetical protein